MSSRSPGYPITRLPDSRWRLVLLAIVPLLAYANSFSAGFPLDNKPLILDDARVHAATRENASLILNHTYWWPVGESGLYRPVTTLSYLFNYAVLGNGDRPAGYHVFNLLLHIVNVWLAFALMRRVVRSAWGPASAGPDTIAVAVAAIWAVHPLSTEAVTNIVGRADLLAACAVLTALLVAIGSVQAIGAPRMLRVAGVALSTLLGVFAKESAAVIPALIALYGAAFVTTETPAGPADERTESAARPRRKARASPAPKRATAKDMAAAIVASALPLIVLWYQRAAVLGAAAAPEFPFVDNPIAVAPFWQGRLTALAVAGRYLWKTVWPATLSADYSYAQIPLAVGRPAEWAAWIAIAAAAAATIALWRRHRPAFFCAAFAAITFAPASNVLFPAGTIMAERVMYLPSLGSVAVVVLTLQAAARRLRAPRLFAAVVVAIAAAFAIRTWTRNPDWRNDVALWSAAVDASPRSFKAHRGLAEALYDSDPAHGNIDSVVVEIEKSVALLAPLPDAQNDARTFRQAGAFYMEQGDLAAAAAPDRSVAMPPARRRAYENAVPRLLRSLAIIDTAHGPSVDARRADALRVLSAVYTRLDEGAKAVEAAARARALDPQSAISYRQSAAALLIAGRNDEAAVELMAGSMATGDNTLRDQLVELYRQGLDPLGCAVVALPNGAALNPGCTTVRRHACAATREAVAIHQGAGRADAARQLQESAARQFGCS